MVEDSRALLRDALLVALVDRDLDTLLPADVAAIAGVPQSTFDGLYGTVESCALAAFDELCDQVYDETAAVLAQPGEWRARLARAMDSMLEQLCARPGADRLWFVELARMSDLRTQQRCTAARDRFARLLADEYRRVEGPGLPDLHFEFLTGALYRAAHDELAAGEGAERVRGRVRELLGLLEPAAA